MKRSARRRRVVSILGSLLGSVAASTAAQENCTPNAICTPDHGVGTGRPIVVAPLLNGQAGGGRAAADWAPSLAATIAGVWSASMGRQDVALGRIDPDHDDDYLYRLPYANGVSYPIIQAYGAKLSHRGAERFTLDFGMPIGTPVHAAREGTVVLLEDSHDSGCWREDCGRLANFVVVLHSDGTTGEYFHLQHGSVQVRLGDFVSRGELLARSGNTGYSTAPHLHFGVYRQARDGSTQSVAVRFRTRTGPIALPRNGAQYLNASDR